MKSQIGAISTNVNATGFTYIVPVDAADKRGVEITMTKSTTITKITKANNCLATIAYITTPAGAVLAQANFAGNDAAFNYAATNITSYFIVCDNGGGNYNRGGLGVGGYPIVCTDLTYISGVYNATTLDGGAWNIDSITTGTFSTTTKINLGEKAELAAI